MTQPVRGALPHPSQGAETSRRLLEVTAPFRWTGLILAGGASLRMGRDKALLSVDGESLLARQARLLREAGAARVLVSPGSRPAVAERSRHLGLPCTSDSPGIGGPAAGLLGALPSADTAHVLALAVDLAGLTPALLARLAAPLASDHGRAFATSGFVEPLAALYPISHYNELLAWSRTGAGLSAWLRHGPARAAYDLVPLSATEAAALAPCNTPEEARALGAT